MRNRLAAWVLVAGAACEGEPAPRRDQDATEPAPTITGPLPGAGAQHHATVSCVAGRCAVTRQVGGGVRTSTLDETGKPTSQEAPPSPPAGWNHPQLAPWGDGWLLMAATSGAPSAVRLDATGAPVSEVMAQHEDWPWGLWPDLALGEDGRAFTVWGTKTTPWYRVFDPETNVGEPAATWEFAWPQATIDPPAATAVPGGYVRAWTEKNGFVWEVRLAWLDLDGAPVAEPVVVAAGEGLSRGSRPQLASAPDGSVALVWRVWEDLGIPPAGAFLRVYEPDGTPRTEVIRLDTGGGDRPAVAHLPDGWLVAWEEGDPMAVWLQERHDDGTARIEPALVASSSVPCGRADLAVEVTHDGWRGFLSWEEVRLEQGDAVIDADVWVAPIP